LFRINRIEKHGITATPVCAHAKLLDPSNPSKYGVVEIWKAIKLASPMAVPSKCLLNHVSKLIERRYNLTPNIDLIRQYSLLILKMKVNLRGIEVLICAIGEKGKKCKVQRSFLCISRRQPVLQYGI